MHYKNYSNSHSKSNRIYSRKEVLDMRLREIREMKSELEAQYRSIGVPTEEALRASSNVVWVDAYKKDDGTEVCGHWRSKPGGGSTADGVPTGAAAEMENYINNISNYIKENFDNAKQIVSDNYEKGMNLQTDYSVPMTNKERVIDALIKSPAKYIYPISSDIYTDGMTDFSRAINNPNAQVLKDMSVLDSDLQKHLKNYGIKANERGVLYNKDASFSKKLSRTKEVKRAILDNYEDIKSDKVSSIPINYKRGDEHYSIQHANIVDPKILDGGRYQAKLIDNVDYARRKGDNFLANIKQLPNNHGVNMQNKKLFENYFPVFELEASLNPLERFARWLKSRVLIK